MLVRRHDFWERRPHGTRRFDVVRSRKRRQVVSEIFEKYWELRMQSAAGRLAAAQQLIKHNPTRGSTAENALRALLREFLPQRCGIGSGFMLAANGAASRQLDIIVFDQFESAPLYRDGDIVIVSPDSAYVTIEVKSNLDSVSLADAFANIQSVKSLNMNVRAVVFAYESATVETLAARLPAESAKYGDLVPDQILCLERRLVITWDPTRAGYDGYELDVGPTQQLVNEVLSAGKVTNLRPYLPSLTPQRRLFQV